MRAGIQGAPFQDDEARFGWALGLGAEWRFAPSWSLKAEYIHVDLGDRRNYGGGGPAVVDVDVDVAADIVRVGVNYNLGPNFWGNLIGRR